jgi:hypothetical protein
MNDIDEWRDKLTVIAQKALATLEARLDPRSKVLVEEFTDNFEFEVAMEWMHGAAISNDPRPLSQAEMTALNELAGAMNIKLAEDGSCVDS